MTRWRARASITVWLEEAEQNGLEVILVTASGCGMVVKDYGFLLRKDRVFAAAARISASAKNIIEYLGSITLEPT